MSRNNIWFYIPSFPFTDPTSRVTREKRKKILGEIVKLFKKQEIASIFQKFENWKRALFFLGFNWIYRLNYSPKIGTLFTFSLAPIFLQVQVFRSIFFPVPLSHWTDFLADFFPTLFCCSGPTILVSIYVTFDKERIYQLHMEWTASCQPKIFDIDKSVDNFQSPHTVPFFWP